MSEKKSKTNYGSVMIPDRHLIIGLATSYSCLSAKDIKSES